MTDLQTARQSTAQLFWSGNGGGGCHWQKEMEVVRITLLQVRVRVLFFFYWGDRMKIDFIYQQFFFACINTWTMWTASFLYETPRSKLNLFIQISLNATPPQKKKSQAQHICIRLERKKNTLVFGCTITVCRFFQLVISLKIMSLGESW